MSGERWLEAIVGNEIDNRCCGDHPGDWGRRAVAGTGWCAECLASLGVDGYGDGAA